MDTDGRPTADEAWAMLPKSEQETVVMTSDALWAWSHGKGKPNFVKRYHTAVNSAHLNNEPVRWCLSLGLDYGGRQRAVNEAVKLGRITREYALRIDGSLVFEEVE